MKRHHAIRIMLAILALEVLTASGCASRIESPVEGVNATDEYPSEVATKVTAPDVGGLPDYAYRSAVSLRGYQIAAREQDLLERLPCYCGCGQEPEYTSLLDCFLEPEGGFRSHGANCQVCLEEAEDAATWKSEGLSTMEIRGRIDAAYEGRGQPTDTPPVLD